MGRKPGQDKAVALVDSGFTADQLKLIKNTIAKGATDDELALFVQICNRTQLDPFARQIHFSKREWVGRDGPQSTMSIQTSIDGLRLIAQRSGEYGGQQGPWWCGKDGQWKDVWVSDDPPAAARIGVIRTTFREPLYRTAKFTSYAQRKSGGELNRMWKTMPDLMLAKCAEALALRAAFPQEMSGLYTSDEMGQAEAAHDDREPVPATEPRALPPPTPTPAEPPKAPQQAPAAPQAQPQPAPAPATPAAPAGASTASGDPVAYVTKAADELEGGLNAVEAWCKKVLGKSWLAARRIPAEVLRVKAAIDDGSVAPWKSAKSTPAPGTPAASPSTVVCKCGHHAAAGDTHCENCGDPIPDAKSPFNNGR